MEFEKFPSLARLRRGCVITEKIDGTNAQICFSEDGDILVGSRKRQIFPEGTPFEPKGCDNQGFAGWVYEHRTELFEFLGEGRHYGEWAGQGIQRRYGLDHKRFYLFNSGRWNPAEIPASLFDDGLDVVPVLFEGDFSTERIDTVFEQLRLMGSSVNPGFDNPEGIVVYHVASRTSYKLTFEHDDEGKGPDRQDKG